MRKIPYLFAILILASCAGDAPMEMNRYTIEQLSKNISIRDGGFSEDESKILYSSNETGIFNLYEVNIGDGSIKQLTGSTEESLMAIGYVPGTRQILYTADKGGNEINHIYLLDEDGSSTDLTPVEQEKAQFYGWSRDRQYLYYGSNARNPQYFDVLKMKVGEWKPEMIYQNDVGLNLAAASDDERYFALNKLLTTSSNQLFLKDNQSGELTEISDPDAPGSYSASGFNNVGTHLFYLCDAGGEFAVLKDYEIATGESSTVYATDWDIMYSSVSENETYRLIAVNVDGKNKLMLLRTADNEKVDLPNIEDGDINSARFSDSEKKILMMVGSSRTPSNIYVYDMETEKLSKLTESLNPEINPDDLVSAEVVRFTSFDELEIPAIYYKPVLANRKNKVPALVWVHGGPGGQSRVGYNALIQYLVNHDYAVLAVNNRGSSGYGKSFYKMDDRNHGDKDLKDCIWGKKWLQEQDYVDPEKIGILGGSYGGYMTMAAMTFAPDEFAVGVDIFGVTNWLRTLNSIPPWWSSFRDALYEEMGDPGTEDSIRLYNISPLFHADQVRNPIMVLQGANDPRVLQVESDEIVEAVRNNGVYVEYVVFPDEGHGFAKTENRIRGYGQILEFLDAYLKGESPDLPEE